jgi:hypothetical protein
MDFWLIAYILVTIVVGSGTVSMLYKRGQTVGAMILLVLLILVFVFYGLRWFRGGNLQGTQVATGTWPPIVNMCPDFMVSYTDTTGVYCYDATNTYGLKTYNGAGLTTGLTINNVPNQSALLMKNPNKNQNATDLKSDVGTTISDYRWPTLRNLLTIAQDPQGKYLKWEGVWDGRSSTPENAPLP